MAHKLFVELFMSYTYFFEALKYLYYFRKLWHFKCFYNFFHLLSNFWGRQKSQNDTKSNIIPNGSKLL